VEWWGGNKRRTSERDVDICERDVVVRFIRAGRAVVVVDVVNVLQDVSVDRTDKWRVPGAGIGVHSERVGRAVVEAILLGELDGHLQQARRREK
jgi:hypothetical protein